MSLYPRTDICRSWVLFYSVGTSAERSVLYLAALNTLSATAISMCSRIERFAGSDGIGGFPIIGTTLLSRESWYYKVPSVLAFWSDGHKYQCYNGTCRVLLFGVMTLSMFVLSFKCNVVAWLCPVEFTTGRSSRFGYRRTTIGFFGIQRVFFGLWNLSLFAFVLAVRVMRLELPYFCMYHRLHVDVFLVQRWRCWVPAGVPPIVSRFQ